MKVKKSDDFDKWNFVQRIAWLCHLYMSSSLFFEFLSKLFLYLFFLLFNFFLFLFSCFSLLFGFISVSLLTCTLEFAQCLWKLIKLFKSLIIILFLFNSFFSWFTNFIQIAWNNRCSLMVLQNILFITWGLILRFFIKVNNLFGILLKGSSHNMVLLVCYVLDHSFKMKFLLGNVFFAFHFLLNLSFSHFIIKFSNDFCFHVLFLFFFSQTSPIELTIFSEKLFTFFDFRKVHW